MTKTCGSHHNKLQGWWSKKQEEEKRNIFGKPFQQQSYHVLLSLMFCCISLLSQSFLSLSLSLTHTHICMSMCQSNPSLSVSWHDANNNKHTGSIVAHKISQFFYCKNPSGALHRCPEPGRVLDWTFLPSFLRTPEDIRCSKNQWFQSFAFMKKLNTLLNVVYLYINARYIGRVI
jgi:hypothetical protein